MELRGHRLWSHAGLVSSSSFSRTGYISLGWLVMVLALVWGKTESQVSVKMKERMDVCKALSTVSHMAGI